MSFAGKVLGRVTGNSKVQPNPDGEKEITVLKGKVGAAGSNRTRPADEGRIVAGNQVRGTPGGYGRNTEELAQLAKLCPSSSQSNAVASKEQRALRSVEHFNQSSNFPLEVVVLRMVL